MTDYVDPCAEALDNCHNHIGRLTVLLETATAELARAAGILAADHVEGIDASYRQLVAQEITTTIEEIRAAQEGDP